MLPHLAIALVALATLGCNEPTPPTDAGHQDLLTGYDLLSSVLSDESHLEALVLLKKLTLRGPVEEVGSIAKKLAAASAKRSDELDKLRVLAPDVTGVPTTRSPVGEAITTIAKQTGTDELLDRGLSFSLRFVLLQAQATRMVSAMADAIAESDPNAKRRAWLGEVADEYEGYREELVGVLALYLRGEGAGQAEAGS